MARWLKTCRSLRRCSGSTQCSIRFGTIRASKNSHRARRKKRSRKGRTDETSVALCGSAVILANAQRTKSALRSDSYRAARNFSARRSSRKGTFHAAAIDRQHFFLAILRAARYGRSHRQHGQLFDRCGGNEEFCTRSIDKSDRDTRRPAGNALAENFPHPEDHGGAAKISFGGCQARLSNGNANGVRRLKAIGAGSKGTNHKWTRMDTKNEKLLLKDEVFQIVGCA